MLREHGKRGVLCPPPPPPPPPPSLGETLQKRGLPNIAVCHTLSWEGRERERERILMETLRQCKTHRSLARGEVLLEMPRLVSVTHCRHAFWQTACFYCGTRIQAMYRSLARVKNEVTRQSKGNNTTTPRTTLFSNEK